MKKNIDISCVLYIVMFIVCYITSNIIVYRQIELFGITASASICIYPLLYLILTLFRERYGKEKAILLLNISVVAMLFSSLLIMIASLFPVNGIVDGLEPIFNNNFRILLASLAGFYFSQNLHLSIYDFLKYSKFLKFLVSAVIAVTADQIVFVLLAYVKKGITINELTSKFTGQYTFNVMAIIIYAIIFGIIMYIKLRKADGIIMYIKLRKADEIKSQKEAEKIMKKHKTKKNLIK